MRLIESLKILKEEMPTQTARNLFLNDIVEPDYENIIITLKSKKRKVLLTKCLQDIRER